MAYSTVILTFNEESNLPRCLESLAGCDDVVVLNDWLRRAVTATQLDEVFGAGHDTE